MPRIVPLNDADVPLIPAAKVDDLSTPIVRAVPALTPSLRVAVPPALVIAKSPALVALV
jgi:hypothetical protein